MIKQEGYNRAALILYHKKQMQELVDSLKAEKKFEGLDLFWGMSCSIPVLKTKGYKFSLEELLESIK